MLRTYLGTGIEYPTRMDSLGRQALVYDAALIKQSIGIILSTPVGSRFRNRSFGSNVHLLIFEPNDFILLSLLSYHIEDAIATWEQRVVYLDTQYSQNGETVECAITYKIKASNTIDTFLYSFKREAA